MSYNTASAGSSFHFHCDGPGPSLLSVLPAHSVNPLDWSTGNLGIETDHAVPCFP